MAKGQAYLFEDGICLVTKIEQNKAYVVRAAYTLSFVGIEYKVIDAKLLMKPVEPEIFYDLKAKVLESIEELTSKWLNASSYN